MSLSSLFAAAAPIAGGLIASRAAGTAPNVPYTGSVAGALQQVGAQAQGLGALGAAASSAAQSWAPLASQSVGQYLNLLQANPYTDSYSAALLAGATGASNQAFREQGAQLTQTLASRGIGGGGAGGASSELAGGLAGIGAAQASSQAAAANQIALSAVQQRYANLAQAAQSAAGYSGQLFGQASAGLGQSGQLYGAQAQGYQALSNAQDAFNRYYAQQASQLGAGIGGALASAFPGFGGLGSLAPLAPMAGF